MLAEHWVMIMFAVRTKQDAELIDLNIFTDNVNRNKKTGFTF
ncbi:hypothetical protein [Enterocloster sp.]